MAANGYEPTLQPSIVPFSDGLFPERLRTSGSLFPAFFGAYLEWMEDSAGQGAATYYTRAFPDLRDVDRTTEEFFVHLKTQYLDGIQLGTESDSRLLLKHAKDLYSAKGTPRGLRLFFRLLFDEVATLYYPKVDILKPSSGTWVKPTYLELSTSPDPTAIESKQVRGLSSGALGFVDSVVTRIMAGRLSAAAYVSALQGTFRTGEVVQPVDGSVPVSGCPTVVGSVNQLQFDAAGSGAGYSVGDVVPFNSPYGVGGLALVTNTTVQTGLVEFSLDSPGYGYSANAALRVSDTVIEVANATLSNVQSRALFAVGATVTQPLATYSYVAANGAFTPGEAVQTYSPNGSGFVLSVSEANSTAGSLLVSTVSGSLHANAIFTTGNAVAANLDPAGGFVDQTATGWVVGHSNGVLFGTGGSGMVVGELVTQANPLWPLDGAVLASGVVRTVGEGFIGIDYRDGAFRAGSAVGQTSGAQLNVQFVSVTVGLAVTNAEFVGFPGNFVYTDSCSGTVDFQGTGTGASFGISPNLAFTETVRVCTDLLSGVGSAMLSGPYGLAGNSSANSSTPFSQMLTFANVSVGQPTGIFTIVPGNQLDAAPYALLYEPLVDGYESYDQSLTITGATSAFRVGEVVTQAATQGRGLVLEANSTQLLVGSLRVEAVNKFMPTTNSTTTLVGASSGSVANVSATSPDLGSPPVGINAQLDAATASQAGAVTAATVLDSGFGYVQGSSVWLGSGASPGANAAQALVSLQTVGTGRGFYSDEGGFLSSGKKLFDGDFYQEFSYQVTSSQTLDKYQQVLKRIMHVAGMKLFGRYLHPRELPPPPGGLGASLFVSPNTSFPAQATDSFDRTDGSLGPNWTQVTLPTYTGRTQVIGDRVGSPDASQHSIAGFTQYRFANDQTATVTVANLAAFGGPAVRVNPRDGDAYVMYLEPNGSGVQYLLYTWNNGQPDSLSGGSFSATALQPTDVVGLSAEGTTLTGTLNGNAVFTFTDAGLTQGVPGVAIYDTGARLDDFVGFPVTGLGPPAPPPGGPGLYIGQFTDSFLANSTALQIERTQPWSMLSVLTLPQNPFSPFNGSVLFTNVAEPPYTGYEVWIDGDGRVRVKIMHSNDDNQMIQVTGTTVVTDLAEHAIGATYDGSSTAAGVAIYVDGRLETVTVDLDALSGTIVTGAGPMWIGNQLGNGFGLNGVLAKFCFTDVVQPGSYFAAHASRGSFPAVDANTTLYYDFTSGSGNTAVDQSASGFDLAISGTGYEWYE